MELTEGTLLDGRVAYRQPAAGYRTGIEPVLLAAWVPARPGDRVLEAGTGAGAGLLCLWRRVPEVDGTGLELDRDLVGVAQANAALNGATGLRFRCCDVLAPPTPPHARYHHVFANPPWHRADGTPSPDPARRRAKQAPPHLLEAWVQALARCLRDRGTLTLVLPAAGWAEAAGAARGAGLGTVALLPLWPRAGQPAKLMLLRGVRGGKGPDAVLPGLVLHQQSGAYTPEAEAVLRDGAALGT